jgi:hypothetical protein
METVLSGLQWHICLIYFDDVIVYQKTFKEMLSKQFRASLSESKVSWVETQG